MLKRSSSELIWVKLSVIGCNHANQKCLFTSDFSDILVVTDYEE